ncbi:ImmA/IrrE family metallo-endopeptidase [Arthrobacter sp. SDTb3-6]|uniref:ImmA/IrrE family metallo-endopeptidase n=1 Tax=Arthrobacter sp. SDTb3-6 TaxID=2713571 RepID=UPI0017BBA6D4|nr:ImmA/IrrE family metallo-endopeptidase [Arthrobacter sp. SDTb3-6]NVM97794.1 ImmA/IrrE family metallo-endopeptidase [Arthrobacter sp. SDTb3-6]
MFDPWGTLRALTHITISWVRMPDGQPGRTDGRGVIWLDKRLQQVERRCTITHEMIHVERGHDGCQRPRIEYQVRAETARRLITIDDLCRHGAWAHNLHELAEELWVTPDVAQDRLDTLTDDEKDHLAAVEHQPR